MHIVIFNELLFLCSFVLKKPTKRLPSEPARVYLTKPSFVFYLAKPRFANSEPSRPTFRALIISTTRPRR